MDQKKPTPFTIVLWALLAVSVTAALFLTPETLNAYQRMETALNATPTPTAEIQSMLLVTFDPNNTPSPTPLVLRAGSTGEEVTRLQERLEALGYYTDEIDGQYGPGSSGAVKLFQTQHGLTADGLAGSETLAALFSDNAQQFIPTPEPSPTPSQLQKGDRNGSVRVLQEKLQALGYYTTGIDGDYGTGTEGAVRRFQAQHGIQADGVATAETMALLNSDRAQAFVPTPTPNPADAPMLVNRQNPVPEGYTPGSLVNLRNALPEDLVYVKGSDIQGDPIAVEALKTMLEAARKDGVTGFQVSAGYRSVSYQAQLFNESVQKELDAGRSRESALSVTRLTVADPGASEHHTGLAFDMTVAGTSFKGTPQQVWLHENCWEYGYVIRYQEDKEKITGIIAEAWHIRYVGIQHSLSMRERNLCLEEYLDRL